MFRLHSLSLKSHPTLGSIDIDFCHEKDATEEPFSTVLIGMNGTGKSYILKTLGDLFYQVHRFIQSEERERITYTFHVRYTLGDDVFDILSSRGIMQKSNSSYKRDIPTILALANRPDDKSLSEEGIIFGPFKPYNIPLEYLKLPIRVIASSTQLNDRFTFKKDEESEVYKYCGAKRTARNISTNAFKRNISEALLAAIALPNFELLLETTIVEYLGFDKHLVVNYRTKYSTLFFTGDLNKENLYDFFIRYKETTKRKTEPWGAWKYKQLIENDQDEFRSTNETSRLDKIIEFINSLVRNNRLDKVRNTDSKRVSFDFFEPSIKELDSSLISDLQRLDLIYLEGVEIRKQGSKVNLEQTSAGENQIVMSLLTILSNIENNSLVLIDEPEISLHPNWQMKYIHLLKKMFKKFADSHFLIATHSHFLISDLKPESSSVISLKRESGKLAAEYIGADTYGWSAEEVLFRVFNVRTTRNYYVEMNLRELLYLISRKSNDKIKIEHLLNELQDIKLGEDDPLRKIVSGATKYLETL